MTSDSDREADEYELALHRKSATRGFVIGGVCIALCVPIVIATGYAYGILVLPGALALANGWQHREKANAIAARLQSYR